MNTIFHDLIGQSVEVYINDIVVKSKSFSEHLVDLEQAFRRMRHYNLRMNPAKCAFGVASGNFLGFMVHNKGIEVDSNKTKAVINARPPENLKQLQGFLGQVNFLRRFVSNAAEKFVWKPPHQQALEAIKESMANPPVLMLPQAGKPLHFYVSATENTVGCLLAQEAPDRSERAIFLPQPALRGRQAKWAVKLAAFDLRYVSIKAVKGQVVANFLVDHPSSVADQAADRIEAVISPMPWILKFDGSSTQTSAGAGVFIESPWGQKWTVARAKAIRVQGDSQLILKQIAGEFQCKDERMRNLRMEAVRMLRMFDDEVMEFIPRAENRIANDLAQEASWYKSSAAGNFKSARVCLCPVEAEDWRMELRKYLEQPTDKTPEKLWKAALKYTLIDGDIFRRTAD
ncbi:uncharacterized protein LOC127264704 [Andrographis paniculata]|uniref:uncharacterized protein LOC127264704 n=1 Tax=Andrographis paniculata TaxID=175694 RepID=UPI0021E8453B|nr:uncharacterized protein LOC127264704 [Andrographis paniculata]